MVQFGLRQTLLQRNSKQRSRFFYDRERLIVSQGLVIMLVNRDYIENANGHVWKKDEDGEVDFFAMCEEQGFHNGPVCVNCGYSFCEHCHSGDLKPCSGNSKN
jgi:hypothetical protein